MTQVAIGWPDGSEALVELRMLDALRLLCWMCVHGIGDA